MDSSSGSLDPPQALSLLSTCFFCQYNCMHRFMTMQNIPSFVFCGRFVLFFLVVLYTTKKLREFLSYIEGILSLAIVISEIVIYL